jgi:uncharacterized protein YjiK
MHTCSRGKKNLFCLILLFSIASCSTPTSSSHSISGYNFDEVDSQIKLPPTLHEISGITPLDSVNFACVQDELGIVFLFNSKSGKITGELPFYYEGDYEGIAKTKNALFILRSDGVLYETMLRSDSAEVVNIYETAIPASNNEGLCFDEKNNRLLIACKSKVGKGKEYKDLRFIYAFDLDTRQLSEEPVFQFDVAELKEFVIDQGIELETKKKKKSQDFVLKFRPSAIGIHPINGRLFLLTAMDHMLFIFDESGKAEYAIKLDSDKFNKSEGIAFFENGDLLITNEGQYKKPSIIRLNYN